MKKLITMSMIIATTLAAIGQETLPPLVDGKAPQTFEQMWAGFDPQKEPLDVEELKEWEQDGVVLKVLRYRIGIFKGQKAMMAAVYGYPKGGSDLLGLVQIHGGGQYAHYNACLTNAKRGYATISISWGGRIDAPGYRVTPSETKLFWEGKTEDPNYKIITDWGALDGYHAPSRYANGFSQSKPHEHTLDAVESPRNDSWFLCALGARRALTFLEQQAEVDGSKLGVYGHSMGGKLTVMVAGADARVKAAAPSCGGISHRGGTNPLISNTTCDDASLKNITCPIFFLSPANDFHGHIEDLQTALSEIKSDNWRVTCAPHHQHQDTKEYEVATQIWFDQILKKSFVTPDTPRTTLELKTSNGVPQLDILPDTTREILAVDVFVSRDAAKTAADRFWHYTPVKNEDGKWTSALELYGLDKPLWVYANVRYKLDTEITGAGYYYGTYTTDSFVLSSKMHMISPEELKEAGVRSVLKADGQIEDFSKDWEKDWYIYGNDPENWRVTTRKLGDDLYNAPAFAKLAFSVRAENANKLVLKMDDKAAVVEIAGGNTWQDVVLYPMDFKGVGGKDRLDWKTITSLQLTDIVTIQPGRGDTTSEPLKAGAKWEGAAPELRDMRWIAGTKAEHNARRTVKLLDCPVVDDKTYLTITSADVFDYHYKTAMNTWLDGEPLVVDGTTYAHGVTTHANSEAIYFLGGKFSRFHAIAQAWKNATVSFEVYIDDKKVIDSGRQTHWQTTPIDLSVVGAQELKLVVTDSGNGKGGDHASWVDAYVTKAGDVKCDVVYKTVNGEKLLLDIYYPAKKAAERAPVFYYTHGGGWWAGSKELDDQTRAIFSRLLDAGVVCVSANYRYAAKGTPEFPVNMRDCVVDCRDGMRYLKKNENELGLDASRIVTFGTSAGAHMSLMLCYSDPDSFVGDPDLAAYCVRPVAGVSWHGPADFTDSDLFVPAGIKATLNPNRFTNRIKTGSSGISYQQADAELKAMMREVSPIYYLTKASPPILQIHGDRDGTIPLKHGQLLQKKAAELGASFQLITVKGAGHGYGGTHTPNLETIIQSTSDFALEQLAAR